jgi:hypothetical protein
VVPSREEPDFHFLPQPFRATQKIEFVFSCQSRNYSRGIQSLRSFAQSAYNGKTWQITRSKKSSLLTATLAN